MNSIEIKKEKRFKFLNLLYEKTDGDKYNNPNMFSLGEKLGFDKKETTLVCQYLIGEGLIENASLGGSIRITHYGVIEIEDALSNPEESTQYFPPVNIVNVHHMENSQIQQGSDSSTQNITVNISNKNDLETFIKLCREHLSDLDLDDDDKSEVESDLSTLESQLSSSRPKNGIVKECLESMKRILEGASGALIAQKLLPLIAALLS